MASLELVPRQKKNQLRDRDWEPLKDLVYTKYLVDGMALEGVVAELQRQGLDANKGNLESKLRNWGFRKKLQPKIWRYVEHVIRDRKISLMKATTVILSGQRIPEEKVKSETTRHNPPTWIRSIPTPPKEDISLYICTPRGSSISLVTGTPDSSRYTYPKGLPWLQFLERDFRNVLKGIEFLPKLQKPVTGTVTEPETTQQFLQIMQRPDVVSLSNSQKSRLLPAVFEQIVQRSLGIAVRSERMAMQLLARKSVDRLAARFDMVLPQAYPNENLRRATTLAGGSLPDIQVELLKILLFLVSNRLIFSEPYHGGLDGTRQLVALCQLSGLSQLQSLQKLVGYSHRSLTITAIIDALFKAAIRTGAAGFACNLLKADCRLRPDKIVGFPVYYGRINKDRFSPDGTPVEFALTKRYESLIKVLVDAGAKLPSYACDDWSLLAVAIYEDFPSTLIQLLHQCGARSNGPRFEAVHAAFMTGNLHLVERLVAQGADLNLRYRGPSVNLGAVILNPFATSDYFHVLRHVDDVGCLGFAASFHSATISTKSKNTVDPWESFAKDQDKALELCTLILTKYRSQIDLSDDRMTADAMILASARGYTKVIAFLHNELSASVNTPSGHLSPLYAAVGWKQVEAAQLLLRLGASSCPPSACAVRTPYNIYGLSMVGVDCPAPSLLQLAISQGSYELTELLIQGDVPIDEARDIALRNNKVLWPPLGGPSTLDPANLGYDTSDIITVTLRSFQLAILSKNWNVGLVLLKHGATATANDLFDVAVEGRWALVEQLLDVGINPSETIKDGITVYEAALYNGHGALAARLAMAGGGGWDEDFASVFRIPDVGYIKTHVPPSLFGEPWKICLDREGRSYLENAFLSHDKEVIMMALNLNATAYDSGALCAEVLSLMKSGQRTTSPFLMELLRRRSLDPGSTHVNLALENHAVSIAAWHACPNIIAALLTRPPPALTQSLATFALPRTKFQKPRIGSKPPSSEYYYAWVEGLLFNGSDNWHMSPYVMVSPLLFAVAGNANGQMVELLLRAGYKADGFTLRAAILQELSFGLIERILDNCEDVDAECAVGVCCIPWGEETPLGTAVRLGRVDIVKTLLAHHADINVIRGQSCETALGEAIRYENLHIVDLLLDAGADVNDPERSAANPFLPTVLQIAAPRGLLGLVQNLIARGADLNARRKQYHGRTALESAAASGRLDTVYLLLEAGTDTEGYGRVQYLRATGLASGSGYGAVVELLKGHREWTGEDFTIWNQLYPSTEMARFSRRACFHPLELPLGELVDRLAGFQVRYYDTIEGDLCYAATPSPCDLLVARLVTDRVAKVANTNRHTTMALTEDAARVAIQAIRKWSDELGTPLTCSSIWNAECGAARRPVEACSVCGFKVWYYLPCSLQSRTKEVAEVAAQSLLLWSPPSDAIALQGATRYSPTFGFDERDDFTIERSTIEDNLLDSHDTLAPNNYNGGFVVGGGGNWEERQAILADMRGDRELSFTPMDCGW